MLGPLDCSAFVLAGGRSSRMGCDKALLTIGGEPLIARALGLLRSMGFAPRITGARSDLSAYAAVLHDRLEDCGPLAAIEAGLSACTTEYGLFLPVDVPLLPAGVLQMMLERTSVTRALVTVPRSLGWAQPLCTVVHRSLLPDIARALEGGDHKVMRVLEQAAVSLAGQAGVDVFDTESVVRADGDRYGGLGRLDQAFLNCNTPEDFARVSAIAQERTGSLHA